MYRECNVPNTNYQKLLLCTKELHAILNETGLLPEPNLLCKEEIKLFLRA